MQVLERGSDENEDDVFSDKPADSNQHILIIRPCSPNHKFIGLEYQRGKTQSLVHVVCSKGI